MGGFFWGDWEEKRQNSGQKNTVDSINFFLSLLLSCSCFFILVASFHFLSFLAYSKPKSPARARGFETLPFFPIFPRQKKEGTCHRKTPSQSQEEVVITAPLVFFPPSPLTSPSAAPLPLSPQLSSFLLIFFFVFSWFFSILSKVPSLLFLSYSSSSSSSSDSASSSQVSHWFT